MKKRNAFAGLLLAGLLWCANSANAADPGYNEFLAMTPDAQEALAKPKIKKNGIYAACKIGRYTVNSEIGDLDAYRWGLLLDNLTDAFIEDGIMPEQKIISGAPQVYIFKDKDSYQRNARFIFPGLEVGWSDGMFVYRGKLAALMEFAFPEKENEDYKKKHNGRGILEEVLLHEGTHQMAYYHLGTAVPVWFNEGMATNMETYDFDMNMKANLYNAMYYSNRADSAVILSEKDALASFPQLFQISSQRWNNASEDMAMVNYATAWAICNFFFTAKKGRNFVGKLISTIKQNNGKLGAEDKLDKMLDTNDLYAIDKLVKEHVKKVLAPCCKYGRQIRKLLNNDQKDQAAELLAKMKTEFPDSNEAKFYQCWLDILNNKAPADAAKAAETLRKTSDFNHPELNYVLALGYFKADNQQEAKKRLVEALKSYSSHKGTLELKALLK